MKAMKRFLSLAMICLLLCGMLPTFALADDTATCNLVLKDTAGKPGDTVTVDLEITSNPGIGALRLNSLDYDTAALELTEVTVADGWEAEIAKVDEKPTGSVVMNRTSDTTELGVIASYTFKILEDAAAGEKQVNLLNCEVASFDNEVMVPFTLTPAKITVEGESGIDPTLKFSSRNITLQDNLQINYRVKTSVLEAGNFTDPYVIFKMNGVETKVVGTLDTSTMYVFRFRNIAPNKLNDTISATLYATRDGKLVEGVTLDWSICQYCDKQLDDATGKTKLTTLLVDLLNYGAQSQIYTGYRTDSLATDLLTDIQRAWGTAEEPTYTTVLDAQYEVVENPLVTWKAISLFLEDTVSIRLKLASEDTTGIVLKVRDDNGNEWSYGSSVLKPTGSEYFFYFNGLKADQMRETVYVTAYKDGVAVSNTVRYSIESYCYSHKTNEALKLLLSAMMKYGDSAYNYAH